MANTTENEQSLFSDQNSEPERVKLRLALLLASCCACLQLIILTALWIILYLNIILHSYLIPWVQKIFIQNRLYSPIWLDQSKIRNRHIHLPISNLRRLVSCAVNILRSRRPNVPYRKRIYPLITLDFDGIDDPTWPDRSLIHTIMLFSCSMCSKDDGIYLVTTSLLQHTTWSTYIGRSDIINFGSLDNIYVYAIQSRGLIFVHVQKQMKTFLLIHNMRQRKTRIIDLSSVFDQDTSATWFLADDGHDWGDVHDQSIYVRAIYIDWGMQHLGPARYGHCLLRISADDQVEKKIIEEIDGPLPSDQCEHYIFRTSTCLGIIAQVDDSDAGIRNIGKPFTIYDLKSRRMMAIRDLKPLLVDDRPIRLIAQRYYKCGDMASLQNLFLLREKGITSKISLNDREGMLVDRKERIWTTRFQPATLKFICLREMFRSYDCRYTAQDWKRVVGINLEKHFR